MNLYPFIEAEKDGKRNVCQACALLEVSRSAYYSWSKRVPSDRERTDAELGEKVVELHRSSRGTYGSPRITAQLRREGIGVAKKRVARLMVARGLAGRRKRRFHRTTISDPAASTPPDLVGRQFAADAAQIDRVWCSDLTYVRTWEGWCYLVAIIDIASRRVVGFAVGDHMRASLVCEAFRSAVVIRRPGPGLIFHSDRGSQYTSGEFRSLLRAHKMAQSLGRPGQCWDNAVAESFFSTLKEELVYRNALPTRAVAKRHIFEFIEVFYNRQRLHSALDYRTPAEYEEETLADTHAA